MLLYLSTLTAVRLMTDDVADNISTNPASLHRTSPPAHTAASLAVISNGTHTNRNSRSATARLIRKDDVTLDPACAHAYRLAEQLLLIQEAQLPQRNSASAAHTCAADALFLCGSCIRYRYM